MMNKNNRELWKATFESDSWKIKNGEDKVVALIEKSENEKAYATIIASSPYMLTALEALLELIGDEDLPDNGELSGGAICDMARTAVALATGNREWPFD